MKGLTYSMITLALSFPLIAHAQEDFAARAMKRRQEWLGKLSGPTIMEVAPQPPATSSLRMPWFGRGFPWHRDVCTTVFWTGEPPSPGDPGNRQSAWDAHWTANYGGVDSPNNRVGSIPASFIPRQNPFYVALPYNDIGNGHTKPEAASVIPWFKEAFVRDGQTTLKGRWVAVRHSGRVAYAQWSDVGPFKTDHWQYVFGNERPRPNLNQSAGLDVSPAVRDYLGMGNKDVCDWKFVNFREVPQGPWALYGDNNTFVILRRQSADRLARK